MDRVDDLRRVSLLAARSWVVPCHIADLDPLCWVVRPTLYGGYANMQFRGKAWLVHRAAYTAMVAEIPEGLQIDHRCSNRSCWNPAHLDPVTRLVNMKRARSRGASRSGVCSNGHARIPENTMKNGTRLRCRICRNNYRRKRREEQRLLRGIFK